MSVLIRLCHSYLSSRHKCMLRPSLEVRENHREYLEAIGNLWSSSGVIRKSLVIIRRLWKIFRNSGYVKMKKVSRIGLKESWQVYKTSAQKSLHNVQ